MSDSMKVLLVGRKAIMEFLGVSWSTVRRYRDNHGMPMLTRPGGRPAALTAEIVGWMVKYTEKTRKKARRNGTD